MNNVTVLAPRSDFNNHDLSLIRRTVAIDTNNDEFDLFISYCRALELDPRRRQIYALVYSKDDPKKRKMSIIVGIDGFRSVAARSGNYRPDDEDPRYEIDSALRGAANPLGLVKASVKVWQFAHGEWFQVAASAYWDEYAPLKEEWSETKQVENGKWKDGNIRYKNVPVEGATKTMTLDPTSKWATMPRLMLAKCAESLALRKAWPDNFSNVYSPEEMDRATVIDITPSEAAAAGAAEDRLAKIFAGKTILIDWMENKSLEPIPVGRVADRVMEFIEKHVDEPSQIGMFQERNRHGLREFWALSPGDALELKKKMEAVVLGAAPQ